MTRWVGRSQWPTVVGAQPIEAQHAVPLSRSPGWRMAIPVSGRLWLAFLCLLAMVWAGSRLYWATGIPVIVTVDGQSLALRTHQRTVAGLLEELGMQVHPQDLVQPGLNTPVSSGLTVTVRRARPVQLDVNGQVFHMHAQARTLRDLLNEAGVPSSPYDEIQVDGRPIASLDTPLPLPVMSPTRMSGLAGLSWARLEVRPLHVAIRHAVPLRVRDGNAEYIIRTTARTVGEALLREQVILYLGDLARPELGSQVVPGLRVYIERSVPFSVHVDGREIRTRTRQRIVADALAELGIVLGAADIVKPSLSAELKPSLTVSITRVSERIEIEQDAISYPIAWVPDDELEIDQRRIDVAGQEGLIKRRFRAVYHDGQLVSRTLEDEWVAQEPITRVIAYGRKIVLRTLETPEGSITYWRKIRMLATSYSPSTAGISLDDDYFGRTRLGWKLRKGIVAVDPSLIKLGSKVYIPGYGLADAADTGGLIRGRHIDLGFEDHNLELWYRWVDVYLLAPPPPLYQIPWILPDWPREHRR
ncbi:MAG: ubiquitin-like domain-containing protein [Anaerolineae bacterium]|nr:ubiquitin-like domain-containing protein [Anaerolineae bacterium]